MGRAFFLPEIYEEDCVLLLAFSESQPKLRPNAVKSFIAVLAAISTYGVTYINFDVISLHACSSS